MKPFTTRVKYSGGESVRTPVVFTHWCHADIAPLTRSQANLAKNAMKRWRLSQLEEEFIRWQSWYAAFDVQRRCGLALHRQRKNNPV